MNELCEIRDFMPSDTNFIYATFKRGVYYGFNTKDPLTKRDVPDWFGLTPKDLFMKVYAPIIEHLLNVGIVKVACLKDEKDVIIGYSITNKTMDKLHWVHVKKAWRKQGIARSLVPTTVNTITHLSALGKTLMNKIDNCIFNPWDLQ